MASVLGVLLVGSMALAGELLPAGTRTLLPVDACSILELGPADRKDEGLLRMGLPDRASLDAKRPARFYTSVRVGESSSGCRIG